MLTIIDYSLKTNQKGEGFYALILQGGLEMVKSKVTERYYATLKKCSISSTFDEPTAKAMVGEKLAGSIQKQSCEPYSFVAKETGEIIEMTHRWVYLPEGASIEEAIFEGEPEVASHKSKIGPLSFS